LAAVTPRTEVAGARSGGVVRFHAGGRYVAVDVPHLFVLLSIEAFCGWYLLDARASSTDIENLLLIQPAAILAFVLAIFILREVITISPVPGIVAPRPPLPSATMVKILGSMAMLGGYVSAMSFLGFVIATAAYVCGSLLSCSLSRTDARFAYRQQPEQVSFWLVPKAGDRT
jgi:hypothetical protein